MDKLENIYAILKSNEKYVDEHGDLLKSAIQSDAMKLDESLLKLLVKDEITKKMFFKDVDGLLVFDKIAFSWVINNKMFLPDSYTSFKNKIGLVDYNKDYIVNSNDVCLSFPYKDCVLEFDATKEAEERNEIFFNENLMKSEIDTLLEPKCFSKTKLIDTNGENSVLQFNSNDNLVIKGNNLIAMHSLLPIYAGQIKLMYWDILYNTNSDDVPYNDSFKHSSWLTMMKNRLEIAFKLLKEDGLIFIHLDSCEMAYLKIIMDEIFLRENYLSTITCKVKAPSGVASGSQMLFDCSEYILVYAKNNKIVDYNHLLEDVEIVNEQSKSSSFYKYILENVSYNNMKLIKDMDGEKIYRIDKKDFTITNMKDFSSEFYYKNYCNIFRTAALSGGREQEVAKFLKTQPDCMDSLFVFEHIPQKGKKAGQICRDLIYKNGGVLMLKDFCRIDEKNKIVIKRQHITNIFTNDWWQGISKEGAVTLKNGKKPEILLKTIIEMASNPNDIVLDSYFGTGTTGAVALKMNRRFIGIEQLNSHYEKSIERLKGVIKGEQSGISKEVNWNGGGSFITFELSKLNEQLINEIQKATNDNINIVLEKIINSDFITYRVIVDNIIKNIQIFNALSLNDKKSFLLSILDKNLLYINYSDIEDSSYYISDTDKKFTKSFYEGK